MLGPPPMAQDHSPHHRGKPAPSVAMPLTGCCWGLCSCAHFAKVSNCCLQAPWGHFKQGLEIPIQPHIRPFNKTFSFTKSWVSKLWPPGQIQPPIFLLDYNCFTILLVSAVQQSESAIGRGYGWTCLSPQPPAPSPAFQVITEHRAELPVLYGTISTHGTIYMSTYIATF